SLEVVTMISKLAKKRHYILHPSVPTRQRISLKTYPYLKYILMIGHSNSVPSETVDGTRLETIHGLHNRTRLSKKEKPRLPNEKNSKRSQINATSTERSRRGGSPSFC